MTDKNYLLTESSVRALAEMKQRVLGSMPRALPTNQRIYSDPGEIIVENTTGSDRNRFDILGMNGPIDTPTADLDAFEIAVRLKGVSPTESTHSGRFVVLQRDIIAGERGPAIGVGLTIARLYDPEGGAVGPYADVREGDTKGLRRVEHSTGDSAPIVWQDSELDCDDYRWVIIALNPQPLGTLASGSGTTTTTTTTSTTTTPEPDSAPCGGTCTYEWDATSRTWSLTAGSCDTTTTTTSTTTTTTTTTTSTTTTTGEPTSSTSSTSSTTTTTRCPPRTTTTTTTGAPTTTPAPCQCAYPPICGLADGDLYDASCVIASLAVAPPLCPPTTTSTTSTTPDCDCETTTSSTTTTLDPTCSTCTWYRYPTEIGWTVQTENFCDASICSCPYPGVMDPCTTVTYPCVHTTTTLPPVPSCGGYCRYVGSDFGWFLQTNTCAASSTWTRGCFCVPPTDPVAECGQIVVSGCQSYAPVTTTTSTTAEPLNCSQICSTSTSTTPSPCDGCTIRVDFVLGGEGGEVGGPVGLPDGSLVFHTIRDGCTGQTCPSCAAVSGLPTSLGATYEVDCTQGTTTTTAAPCNRCIWRTEGSPGSYSWGLADYDCDICGCDEPASAATVPAQLRDTVCNTSTTTAVPTTTTTTTSTTTTSTTTTAEPCRTAGCKWYLSNERAWVQISSGVDSENCGPNCPSCCYPYDASTAGTPGSLISRECQIDTLSCPTTTTTTTSTSTTSTTTTSTSTTAPPCGTVTLQWIEPGIWTQTSVDCTGECSPPAPPPDGTFYGETTVQSCV